MNERATPNANVKRIKNGWKLSIEKGDSSRYRDAQLDDYSSLSRIRFPHRPASATPFGLSLRARASSASIPGTWGFGLWNDPFGLSLGFGGNPFRLPALPNAVWFFHASKENYLSFKSRQPQEFKDGQREGFKEEQPQGIVPTNGFFSQTFKSPKFHPLLILAGLAFPFSRKTTRKLLGKIIDEDGVALGVDVTEWHSYRLEWSPKRVAFWVDHVAAFESPVSPHPPLGVIIWMDNQYAAFTPEGKLSAGVLANEESWLEVENIIMEAA